MKLSSKKAPAGTQALQRGIAVLKAFTEERPEQTLTRVAEIVGLNKTTAYRLLSALEAEGLVVRVGEAYRLGPEAIVLGARASRARDLVAAGHAELAALAQETGETVTLEVLVGDDVLIMDEVHGRHLIGSMPAVGTRWSAHATATGKVLLAFTGARPDGRLARHTRATITSARKLADEMAAALENGWAMNLEELEPGYVAVAAPVRDYAERVIAAVSIGGPTTRLTRERLAAFAPRVKRTAARISQQLGSQT